MNWNDTLTLIAAETTEETNENGFEIPEGEGQKRTVYANKKSVGISEFYKAQQSGYSADLKFDVYTDEYQGEPFAEYQGRRYKVLRTYESKNGETIELTLSDLSQRGEGSGTDQNNRT